MINPEINWNTTPQERHPDAPDHADDHGNRAARLAGTVIAWTLTAAVTVTTLLLLYKLAKWALL